MWNFWYLFPSASQILSEKFQLNYTTKKEEPTDKESNIKRGSEDLMAFRLLTKLFPREEKFPALTFGGQLHK